MFEFGNGHAARVDIQYLNVHSSGSNTHCPKHGHHPICRGGRIPYHDSKPTQQLQFKLSTFPHLCLKPRKILASGRALSPTRLSRSMHEHSLFLPNPAVLLTQTHIYGTPRVLAERECIRCPGQREYWQSSSRCLRSRCQPKRVRSTRREP